MLTNKTVLFSSLRRLNWASISKCGKVCSFVWLDGKWWTWSLDLLTNNFFFSVKKKKTNSIEMCFGSFSILLKKIQYYFQSSGRTCAHSMIIIANCCIYLSAKYSRCELSNVWSLVTDKLRFSIIGYLLYLRPLLLWPFEKWNYALVRIFINDT